jgi:hypothetical protein
MKRPIDTKSIFDRRVRLGTISSKPLEGKKTQLEVYAPWLKTIVIINSC